MQIRFKIGKSEIIVAIVQIPACIQDTEDNEWHNNHNIRFLSYFYDDRQLVVAIHKTLFTIIHHDNYRDLLVLYVVMIKLKKKITTNCVPTTLFKGEKGTYESKSHKQLVISNRIAIRNTVRIMVVFRFYK